MRREAAEREPGAGKMDNGAEARNACEGDGGRQTAAARPEHLAAALRLFGGVFEREIDARLLAQMREAGPELREALGDDPLEGLTTDDEDALGTLAAEYCRLFIGPRGHLPPAESVVLGEGRFWGAATEGVVAFYRSAGVGAVEGARVVPDHISMELDCLAILEESGRHEEAALFARAHVLQWLPELSRHVERASTLAFYSALAKGLEKLLTELYGTETCMCRDEDRAAS
jgi:TorA maturation chaperone TorD